eukprot:6182499-Amphidinium_carterae.1
MSLVLEHQPLVHSTNNLCFTWGRSCYYRWVCPHPKQHQEEIKNQRHLLKSACLEESSHPLVPHCPIPVKYQLVLLKLLLRLLAKACAIF